MEYRYGCIKFRYGMYFSFEYGGTIIAINQATIHKATIEQKQLKDGTWVGGFHISSLLYFQL